MTRTLAISLALLAAACGSRDWVEIRSKEGRFAIRMPAAPAPSTREVETGAGPIALRLELLSHRGFDYMVGYSDYPAEFAASADPAAILDGARDGAAARLPGTLLEERPISLGEHRGRAIALQDANAQRIVQLRLLLVGRRLYQFGIATPARDRGAAEVEQFLDSFALLQN